jgi:hypothetical protein
VEKKGIGNREQFLLEHRTPPWHACEVEGCEGLSLGHRYCNRCNEEIGALRRINALYAPEGADDVAEEFVETGTRAIKGLRNMIWAAGTIAVFYYLLWQFRGFIYNCFVLWFGR